MPGTTSTVQPIGDSFFFYSVLVDTGAFLALWSSRDNNHQAAVACLGDLEKYRLPLVVSLPTIYESHSRILYDVGERKANLFLHRIMDGSLNIWRTVLEDEQAAIAILDRFSGQNITLVDACNMALMNRLGIRMCFSFDHHFAQVGFIVIPPFHL